MDAVAEGVNTTVAALEMAEKLEVDMPITRLMSRVLLRNCRRQSASPSSWSGRAGGVVTRRRRVIL